MYSYGIGPATLHIAPVMTSISCEGDTFAIGCMCVRHNTDNSTLFVILFAFKSCTLDIVDLMTFDKGLISPSYVGYCTLWAIKQVHIGLSAADLEGPGRAGSALPRGRRTDAVTHGTPDMRQRYCIMATPAPVSLFKHLLQRRQSHGVTRLK